jgi:site-specific recombinase XerD
MFIINRKSPSNSYQSISQIVKADLIIKGYSKSTINTYCCCLQQCETYFAGTALDDLSKKDFIDYFLFLRSRNCADSTLNQHINALKYYFENILGRDREVYYLPRPKKKFTLPKTISKEEVESIINTISNLKHKTMVCVIYANGLRISELLNLKIADINGKSMQISIIQSKGKKDRMSAVNTEVLTLLRKYYTQYRPKTYLFEGTIGNKYSAESVRKIIHRATRKAKINKTVTPHMLRHSYATHLLESGVDIRYIKELLGHSCIKTTEIYAHCANKKLREIKSPIADLNIF